MATAPQESVDAFFKYATARIEYLNKLAGAEHMFDIGEVYAAAGISQAQNPNTVNILNPDSGVDVARRLEAEAAAKAEAAKKPSKLKGMFSGLVDKVKNFGRPEAPPPPPPPTGIQKLVEKAKGLVGIQPPPPPPQSYYERAVSKAKEVIKGPEEKPATILQKAVDKARSIAGMEPIPRKSIRFVPQSLQGPAQRVSKLVSKSPTKALTALLAGAGIATALSPIGTNWKSSDE